jgi:hypothetical protein
MDDCELWGEVPEMDGKLWVSSTGRICQYNAQKRTWIPPRTGATIRHGYPTIVYNKKIYRVHYLVAITFIGPKPSSKHTVDHIAKYDGDWQKERSDNRASNLRWATRTEQRSNQNKSSLRIDRASLEETKPVPDDEEFREVEGVFVSQYGRTRNFYGLAYTPKPNKSMDYAAVGTKRRPMHVLVALAFPDLVAKATEGQTTVDHTNRDKTDNRACNLRWATRSEQQDNTTRPDADDIRNHKEAIEVRPPGSSVWTSYISCSSASRGIKKEHGRSISAQSLSQFLRKNPKGGTIQLRQNVGWSFRPARNNQQVQH